MKKYIVAAAFIVAFVTPASPRKSMWRLTPQVTSAR
jgi:hypothetical protein